MKRPLPIVKMMMIWGIFSLSSPVYARNLSQAKALQPGSRAQITDELLHMKTAGLVRQFSELKSGALPEGVYTLRVLPGDGPLPGGNTKKTADLLWSARVYNRNQGVVFNRTVTGDRMPGKVYCLTSPTDFRQESIIVDFRHSDRMKSYDRKLDWIAGPEGLNIHEELRYLQPGLMLGKVWSNGAFLHFYVAQATHGDPTLKSGDCQD